jgi:Domain of unknown function (DUF5664)
VKLGIESAGLAPGQKFDQGKARLDLVPWGAVMAVATVLTFGAIKYGPNSWQKVERFEGRYFAALLRHLVAWLRGERCDPESGLQHLAHAACCLLFLLSREVGFDPTLDAPAPAPVAIPRNADEGTVLVTSADLRYREDGSESEDGA